MSIQAPKPIKDNLKFLCAEVESQLGYLLDYFDNNATPLLARRILDRRGYASNLKRRIYTTSLDRLANNKGKEKIQLHARAIELVAANLEELTYLSRSCIEHSSYIVDFTFVNTKKFLPIIKLVRKGIKLVLPAIESNNIQLALQLNQIELAIERSYKKIYKAYIAELKTSQNTEDLTRALFIAQNLKQMGDEIKELSEAILSANLGQSVNFERYHTLQSMMSNINVDDLQIETIAETRSGSSITGITSGKNGGDDYLAIFKDGIKSKVKEERQGVKNWHEIYPGLAPKILSYKKRGQSAAILIEHLPGQTYENILINESSELTKEALKALGSTLRSVWRKTRSNKKINAEYLAQLEKRLPSVYDIHPEFKSSSAQIGQLKVPSFKDLVNKAQAIEKALPPPFSVYIHGDFNVDNIIYDPLDKRINFIDLHRSQYMDYVQDVSVFMVSNYRLQILDNTVRKRIMWSALEFYKMSKRFAQKEADETFELRLALGLARSFVSSTRFILDKSLSRRMFLRARYLLELLIKADLTEPEIFKVPVQEIFVD